METIPVNLTQDEIDDLGNYADYQAEHWSELKDSHSPNSSAYQTAKCMVEFYTSLRRKLGVRYEDEE